MEFVVNSRIFKEFPGVRIAAIIAHDIDNVKTNPEVTALLQQMQDEVRAAIALDDISSHPIS